MAKRNKGLGAYTNNDTSYMRRDKTVDDSGNPRVPYRQISDIDSKANSSDAGATTVTDAGFSRAPRYPGDDKIGGGAMSRGVSSPKAKRHDGF